MTMRLPLRTLLLDPDLHSTLNPFLQDLELSFCPEIGDATAGSLAVTTSKDSSIDGPGYLSALVTEVKYVDEVGTVPQIHRSHQITHLKCE